MTRLTERSRKRKSMPIPELMPLWWAGLYCVTVPHLLLFLIEGNQMFGTPLCIALLLYWIAIYLICSVVLVFMKRSNPLWVCSIIGTIVGLALLTFIWISYYTMDPSYSERYEGTLFLMYLFGFPFSMTGSVLKTFFNQSLRPC
jgi:hypothetical protein